MTRDPFYDIQSYLAAGFTSAPFIDALITNGDGYVLQVLSQSPHLTDKHISRLLADTANDWTAQIAFRQDLTEQHMRHILSLKQITPRHILLTSRQQGTQVTDSLARFILDAPWFTPSYARLLLGLLSPTSKLQAKLSQASLATQPYNTFRNFSRNSSRASSENYRLYIYEHFQNYYTNTMPSKELLQEIMHTTIDELEDILGGTARVNPTLIATQIQSALSGASPSVLMAFCELLPDWGSTLQDLIHTVSSLESTPKLLAHSQV